MGGEFIPKLAQLRHCMDGSRNFGKGLKSMKRTLSDFFYNGKI